MDENTLTGVRYEDSHLPLHRIHLIFGPDRRRRGDCFELGPGGLVFGRQAEDGETIDDPRMSRVHARVHRGSGRSAWLLEDMGSKNKVQVGGANATTHLLEDGDVFRLGDSLFTYEVADRESVEAPVDAGFVGRSAAVRKVLAEARIAARSRSSLLIGGETGSGKEVLCRRLHAWSARVGALVPVNCGAIPSQLIESTLFGHRRGAFTGAVEHNEGYFVAADQGTIFLDEVAELSAAVQAALLRVLEDGLVTPVGATRGRRVDVRVVAATHRDLRQSVVEGTFRADLYTRLAGWFLAIPPLRTRPLDILPLVAEFLGRGFELDPDAAEALVAHQWPGNVRELKSVITRAEALAGPDGAIGLGALPEPIAAPIKERATLPAPELASSRGPSADELAQVLEWAGGNVARVAERYGRTRKQIYRWIDRHGIDLEALRGGGS